MGRLFEITSYSNTLNFKIGVQPFFFANQGMNLKIFNSSELKTRACCATDIA